MTPTDALGSRSDENHEPQHVRELRKRLRHLLGHEGAAEFLGFVGLGGEPLSHWRPRDLAVAVHRLEHLLERERAQLVPDEDCSDEMAEFLREVADEELVLESLLLRGKSRAEAPVGDRPQWAWEIAIAVNAAFKGLLGSLGQSGHICARADPVAVRLDVDTPWTGVIDQLVAAVRGAVVGGDVLVLADKVVAVAQGRVGPMSVLSSPDPKTIPPSELEALAAHWTERLGFAVTPLHLLLADEYGEDKATLGTADPNQACAEVASAVRKRLGVSVDVVISDTDTGLDVRQPLIGILTIAATPLGATAGLTLYEAMRCAVAAEFIRGHTRGIPLVICHPAERRRRRDGTGRARPYRGPLNASRESTIAHA